MVTGAIIVVAVRARMQVSRSFPRQEEGPRTGGNRQREHPLHVPRHTTMGLRMRRGYSLALSAHLQFERGVISENQSGYGSAIEIKTEVVMRLIMPGQV